MKEVSVIKENMIIEGGLGEGGWPCGSSLSVSYLSF